MRTHLSIFSGAIILILGFLHVQPLLWRCEAMAEQIATCATEAPECIKEQQPICKRNKCTLPVPAEEKEDCNNSGCNPCVPCSAGFCCYLVENVFEYHVHPSASKINIPLLNDNRLASGLSECWHPPELIS